MTLPPLQHRQIATNGVSLHVVEAGPEHGPLVVLLHGFPEFWYGWRQQIGPLAAAGYRVWAVDQRGYNLSSKPEEVDKYSLENLAADVAGLIQTSGRHQIALVGHDWGGGVAWHTALRYPARLSRLIVLNCPHGAVMRKHLRGNPRQMLRSWYIYGLQAPWVPEKLLSAKNGAAMAKALCRTSNSGSFTPEDIELYRQAWAREGAWAGMVNWYRAAKQFPPKIVDETVSVPTLLIWGARDRFLGRQMAAESIEHCQKGRLEMLENATHWVQHDQPQHVNALIDQFLR